MAPSGKEAHKDVKRKRIRKKISVLAATGAFVIGAGAALGVLWVGDRPTDTTVPGTLTGTTTATGACSTGAAAATGECSTETATGSTTTTPSSAATSPKSTTASSESEASPGKSSGVAPKRQQGSTTSG